VRVGGDPLQAATANTVAIAPARTAFTLATVPPLRRSGCASAYSSWPLRRADVDAQAIVRSGRSVLAREVCVVLGATLMFSACKRNSAATEWAHERKGQSGDETVMPQADDGGAREDVKQRQWDHDRQTPFPSASPPGHGVPPPQASPIRRYTCNEPPTRVRGGCACVSTIVDLCDCSTGWCSPSYTITGNVCTFDCRWGILRSVRTTGRRGAVDLGRVALSKRRSLTVPRREPAHTHHR
jgi:hypothetical protein